MAQNADLFEDSYSPLQSEYVDQTLRPETEWRNLMLSNPALLHRMIAVPTLPYSKGMKALSDSTNYLFVTAEGATGNNKGDYMPVKGNKFNDFTVRSLGYSRSSNHLLLGKANFTTGRHGNIGWNTQRNPDLYWPYLLADSTGGNVRYETYGVMCAYSFNIKKAAVGVQGEYKGDYAFTQNDPRKENISSWFSLKAGAAMPLLKGTISASAQYTRHRQQMKVKHFRSGQFTNFFTEYGFGMFDYIYSPVFNYTSERRQANTWVASVAYLSDQTAPLRVLARLNYSVDVMKTEESTYHLNLYRATTNTPQVSLGALWNNQTWGIAVLADAQKSSRHGRENLFERYVSATVDGVDVYDYRLTGHQDRYKLSITDARLSLKASRFLSDRLTLSVLGGASYWLRDETYSDKGYQISNALLTPKVGVEAQYAHEQFGLTARLTYGRRFCVDNKYNVGLQAERQTEFQHAFATYAYYANEGSICTAELTATRAISDVRLGLRLQMLYIRADRLSSVSYDESRFETAVPKATKHSISLTPDRHNAFWLKAGVFVEF